MKTVLLCGWNGYIGTALTQTLLSKGYRIIGIDNQQRRLAVEEAGSISAVNQLSAIELVSEFEKLGEFTSYDCDIDLDKEELDDIFQQYDIDIVLNLAHIPSAPFSQKNWEQANTTLINNVLGTNNLLWCIKEYCIDAHYITIGSTGEYDHQLNVDIEEGYFQFTHKDRLSKECLFPRKANSIYHSSKIASTYIIDYLTKIWGLKCTDVMQAVVFGSYTDESSKTGIHTRLDSDEQFGTLINRLVVQSIIGEPMTIYGEGKHQRAFLSLNDSIQALMIAVENPPEKGVVQSWNQLSEWHSINDVAQMVKDVAKSKWGIDVETQNIPTPRGEYTGEHYYHYVCDKLPTLGYKPTRTMKEEIDYMMDIVSYNLSENPEVIEVLKKNVIPKIKF